MGYKRLLEKKIMEKTYKQEAAVKAHLYHSLLMVVVFVSTLIWLLLLFFVAGFCCVFVLSAQEIQKKKKLEKKSNSSKSHRGISIFFSIHTQHSCAEFLRVGSNIFLLLLSGSFANCCCYILQPAVSSKRIIVPQNFKFVCCIKKKKRNRFEKKTTETEVKKHLKNKLQKVAKSLRNILQTVTKNARAIFIKCFNVLQVFSSFKLFIKRVRGASWDHLNKSSFITIILTFYWSPSIFLYSFWKILNSSICVWRSMINF